MSEYLSRSLDGELSEVEQTRLDVHLAQCGACGRRAAATEGATRLLRATPLEELDSPIVLPRSRRSATRVLQAASVAAAAVAALGITSVFRTVQPQNARTLGVAANPQPAYLQSPEYELRIMQHAVVNHARPHVRLTR